MTQRQHKTNCFFLEGLNSFATTLYFYYIFIFMEKTYGFQNMDNLFLAAAQGLVYMMSAWFGGRVGQRHGYYKALKIGFTIMSLSLIVGAYVTDWRGHVAVMIVCTFGMCFTWPNLEAVVSENETPRGLQTMIGIYNLVWAGVQAIAFFIGGALLEKVGMRSMFWIPASVHIIQLLQVLWLERQSVTPPVSTHNKSAESNVHSPPHRPVAKAKSFLRMAWLSNPFAYVAINTIVAVIPGIARKLDLTPTFIGFFCSIWFFARLGTFLWLWLWTGWHYKFRWFITSYILLIAGFAVILLSSTLWVIIGAQVAFGMALGLIYYSSLFYSMDVGEEKGEHGGFHEAAIGAGIFAGPAVGATSLYFFPAVANSSTVAVSGLLGVGLIGLLVIRLRSQADLARATLPK